MKLKTKMILGATLLAALLVITAGLIIESTASSTGHEALEYAARERLIAVRDLSKRRIEDYLQTIKKQVLTFSKDRMIVDAMRQFKDAFTDYKTETAAILAENRGKLATYYRNDFTQEYQRRNLGNRPDVAQWLGQLDEDTIALQYQFIKANPQSSG